MSQMSVRLEVDRLNNLITGFGWTIRKQEVTTDQIILTVVKSVEIPGPAEGIAPE